MSLKLKSVVEGAIVPLLALVVWEACARAGLTGRQGVLIPARNRRHLMLHPRIVEAVRAGRFQVHAVDHVSDGVALLTGQASGIPYRLPSTPADAVVRGTRQAVSQRSWRLRVSGAMAEILRLVLEC